MMHTYFLFMYFQLSMYKERYEEFQSTIKKSEEIYSKFKVEMEKVSRKDSHNVLIVIVILKLMVMKVKPFHWSIIQK